MSNEHFYLIALGSNKRHALLGHPAKILEHAIAALEMDDVSVFSHSPIIASRPQGPSQRNFANSAVLISAALMPDELPLTDDGDEADEPQAELELPEDETEGDDLHGDGETGNADSKDAGA